MIAAGKFVFAMMIASCAADVCKIHYGNSMCAVPSSADCCSIGGTRTCNTYNGQSCADCRCIGSSGCSRDSDCGGGNYCDSTGTCYTCNYITPRSCDAKGGSCCSASFLEQCPSNPHGCYNPHTNTASPTTASPTPAAGSCSRDSDCGGGNYCGIIVVRNSSRECKSCSNIYPGSECDAMGGCCSTEFVNQCATDDPWPGFDCDKKDITVVVVVPIVVVLILLGIGFYCYKKRTALGVRDTSTGLLGAGTLQDSGVGLIPAQSSAQNATLQSVTMFQAGPQASTPWLDTFDTPKAKKVVGIVWLAFLGLMVLLAATGAIGNTSNIPDIKICGISPDSVSVFYNIGLVLFGVFQLTFGPILCFFGYKYFKISLFLLGGAPFGVATYMSTCVATELGGGGPGLPLLYGLGAFCIGGALMVCCWFLTVFCMGCSTGMILCVFCYVYIFAKALASDVEAGDANASANTTFGFISRSNLEILIGVSLVVGIFFGYLAIKFQRIVIIWVTALFGSFTCWSALFVNFFKVDSFPAPGTLVGGAPIDQAAIGYLVGVFLLAVCGVYVQLKKTSIGFDHKNSTWRGEQALVMEPVGMAVVNIHTPSAYQPAITANPTPAYQPPVQNAQKAVPNF